MMALPCGSIVHLLMQTRRAFPFSVHSRLRHSLSSQKCILPGSEDRGPEFLKNQPVPCKLVLGRLCKITTADIRLVRHFSYSLIYFIHKAGGKYYYLFLKKEIFLS